MSDASSTHLELHASGDRQERPPTYIWVDARTDPMGERPRVCSQHHDDVMYQTVESAQEEIRQVLVRTRRDRLRLDRIEEAIEAYKLKCYTHAAELRDVIYDILHDSQQL